ncbi:VOC family protein [Actinophytocola sp.]|uniref:VOC family protein n=1 Tax=Actinophytocola sp. TaxID=1872138 RepID=UPI002ED87C69
MTDGFKTIIFPVSDLDKAKAVFNALLGTAPEVEAPYYVGYKVAGQDIGLNPNGHATGMTGPVTFHHVADIKATHQALLDAGATANDDIKEVGGGRLVGSVKDADGNVIGLLQD